MHGNRKTCHLFTKKKSKFNREKNTNNGDNQVIMSVSMTFFAGIAHKGGKVERN